MDIEQLKLVLETVRGVTGDAQIVAVWWIVIDKVMPMLCWMTVFFTLIFRLPLVVQMLDDSDDFLKEARNELGTGISGCLTPSERVATERALMELVRNRNK